jgi:hypothetical protein
MNHIANMKYCLKDKFKKFNTSFYYTNDYCGIFRCFKKM